MSNFKKKYLLSPGPTQVPPDVLAVASEQLIHHRTPEFSAIFREVSVGLQYLFQTKNEVYTLTSSGTGAMESAVVNTLSPGDKAIVVEAGKFGERWTKILKVYGMEPVVIKIANGEVATADQIETALKNNRDAKAVFVQSVETATAVSMDIRSFGKVVAGTDAILVVDGISGIGAEEFRMDDWGVDVAIMGSQKGLMIPPGLAFISASDKAWRLIEKAKAPRFYFDMVEARKALKNDTSSWTPAISLVMQLSLALKMIRSEGIENVWARHAELAEMTRAGVRKLGLELLAKKPANSVTAAIVPANIDGSKLVKYIRDELGVTLAGGQGDLKGRIFRIGHLGYAGWADITVALKAVEIALAKFNKGDSSAKASE